MVEVGKRHVFTIMAHNLGVILRKLFVSESRGSVEARLLSDL